MGRIIINGVNYSGGGGVADPNVADAYSSSNTYNTGDYCIYNNTLYKCNDDNVTGTWDSTKWDATKISDELELKVNKSGDTMTGNLLLSANTSSPECRIHCYSDTDAGALPSTPRYQGIYVYSKDGKTLGKITADVDTYGNTDVEIYSHGYDSSGNIVSDNQLHIYSNRDGTHNVVYNYPEDWANALIQTISASDYFVNTSGVTDFYAYRMGKLIIIDRCVFNKYLSASGTTEFAQIIKEFCPPKSVRICMDDGSSNTAFRAFIEPISGSTNGHITTNVTSGQSSSNYFFLYNFAYITN